MICQTKSVSDAVAPPTLVTILLWAQVALAHPQAGEAKGFLTGFRHPISGLDHVLAMVAVGLWGAQLGSPAIWLLPVAFPMVMAFGGMLGLMGVPLPGWNMGSQPPPSCSGRLCCSRCVRRLP